MRRTPRWTTLLLALALGWLLPQTVFADEQQAAHFFETKVRPLLAQHCYQCHGPNEQKADLRLDRRSHFLKGGVGGPVVEAGDPDESVLIQAVRYEGYEMPPAGPLPDEDVAILE